MNINTALIPPGGWYFMEGDVRIDTATGDFNGLVEALRLYRSTNNRPMGSPDQEITNQVCARSGHFCSALNMPAIAGTIQPRLNEAERIVQWALKIRQAAGAQGLIGQEVAEHRAQTCRECPQNKPWRHLCPVCVQQAESLLGIIRQGRDVANSNTLKGCGIGLDNRTAVWLEKYLITEHMPDNCWKNKE